MKKIPLKLLHSVIALVLIGSLTFGAVYALALTIKPVRAVLEGTLFERFLPHEDDERDCDHDHDHDETAATLLHGQAVEIALSPTAAKNIGIDDSAIMTVEVLDFYKSLSFPAIVAERPGFSMLTVSSPVSGVVAKIHHESGVAVMPGEPLFDILLNQQELVKAQAEFLALLQKREINDAERERLANVNPQAVPGQHRTLEYEKRQIDSEIDVQKKVLLLQGLSETDITDSLEKNGTMIRTMTVYAPPFIHESNLASTVNDDEGHIFTIDELYVTTGKNVEVGDSLCRLFDYCNIAIKGKVFAANEKFLVRALASKSRVTASFEGNGSREIVDGLFLRSIDNKIDATSGTLFCYVDLRNRFVTYEVSGESNMHRYVKWHFKPGQRCELNVEYEPLPNCIVLPVDAVARDLLETCIFEWVGNEGEKRIWRKTPVHLVYQTKDVVAIANDGSVFPGAKVATKGASFILAALEAANQRAAGGGGIDHGDHVH